jgi:ribonuclease Z
MQFEVTILGSNAAIPAFDRYPSSQIVTYDGRLFMIDCGEGAQFRMNQFGIKRARLDNIFISHLHGDHFYGLIGLLTSFNLNWREHALHLYAPPGLKEIIDLHFKHSLTQLRYELIFHPITADKPSVIFEDSMLTVETIILTHRLPTTGFLFREKKNLRKIVPEKLAQYNIPHHKIAGLKKGEDYIDEAGNKVPNAELTHDPLAARSYAYCSDTAYTESFIEQIKDVTLLYHEATFINEHEQRALETFHSTTKQAGKIAKLANAQQLLIGHFSARYENLDFLLNETRKVFPNTFLAEEGKTFVV